MNGNLVAERQLSISYIIRNVAGGFNFEEFGSAEMDTMSRGG